MYMCIFSHPYMYHTDPRMNNKNGFREWCCFLEDPLVYTILGDADAYIDAHLTALKFLLFMFVVVILFRVALEALLCLTGF